MRSIFVGLMGRKEIYCEIRGPDNLGELSNKKRNLSICDNINEP